MSVTAIFGAGIMGEALLGALLRGRWEPADIVVAEKRPERAEQLRSSFGVEVISSAAAAERASTLVLVVKPQDMNTLVTQISGVVDPQALVVCLAAGITTSFLEERLPTGMAVVRAMPNTPSLVDEGMAAISPGRHCTEQYLARAQELLGAMGKVVRVPEDQQDAVTAVSGSGPAYIFYIAEAMIEAGVSLGLSRASAAELVKQTIYGSASMLREPDSDPSRLRENVTSPGGTTAAALRELDNHHVKAAFARAMAAARDRSRELASGR